MERQTALVRLRKLLGKEGTYRENKDWKGPDVFKQAHDLWREEEAKLQEMRKQLDARREIVLKEDVTYQDLMAKYRQARETRTPVPPQHRFDVGTANNLFFHVYASGDSWEDIFRKLQASHPHLFKKKK